jgi:hypothetical protein
MSRRSSPQPYSYSRYPPRILPLHATRTTRIVERIRALISSRR